MADREKKRGRLKYKSLITQEQNQTQALNLKSSSFFFQEKIFALLLCVLSDSPGFNVHRCKLGAMA